MLCILTQRCGFETEDAESSVSLVACQAPTNGKWPKGAQTRCIWLHSPGFQWFVSTSSYIAWLIFNCWFSTMKGCPILTSLCKRIMYLIEIMTLIIWKLIFLCMIKATYWRERYCYFSSTRPCLAFLYCLLKVWLPLSHVSLFSAVICRKCGQEQWESVREMRFYEKKMFLLPHQ